MTITINSDDARVRLSEILDQVSGGDQFIVARYDQPIGVLIPHGNWIEYQKYLAFQQAKRVKREIELGHMGVTTHSELTRLMHEKATANVGN